MKFNIKLLTIPIVVLISLVYISFIFSSEIDKLKKQIDNIYFGNFIPTHKLHIISNEYNKIIYNPIDINKNKEIIIKNWKFYNNQYKTDKERIVIDKIDKFILATFEKNTKEYYQFVLKQISLLIEHEIYSASTQRKIFLNDYNKLKQYLLYNQIAIIIFIVLFMIFMIFLIIKNNKKQEYLIEKYKQDSITDGLTKLYNRKYFDTIFDDITIISSDNNWVSAFVMIDIDFFKQYNDTYGHDAGDEALKSVAKMLDKTFKNDFDYVFRLGGEEFGILAFDTNIQILKENLNNVKINISKLNIEHSASATNLLTLSMGVVIINEDSYNSSCKELYKLADGKLYNSKENGRDQYTI